MSDPLMWLRKAQAFHVSGQNPEALDAYRRFLELYPAHAGALGDLGGLFKSMGRLQEALETCGNALSIDPGCLSARINLGCTRMEMGQLNEAEGHFRQALAQDPRRLDARLDLAECLIQRKDLDLAMANLGKAIRQDPGNLLAFRKLIYIHALRGEWEALRAEIQRRLSLEPGCPEAMLELSNLDLLMGVMPLGWDEYESRFRLAEQTASFAGPFPQPLWDGRPFPGKTLLLHWEQGFGDTLMFIRYASMAKALGGRVLLLAQPSLVELAATCPGVDQVFPHGDPLPPFDYQLPLMSLPRVFRTDLETIPGDVPYLGLPERIPNREGINGVLSASEGRIRVGLAWAGRSTYLNDRKRSLMPELLAPLKALEGVAWHSFQVPAQDCAGLPCVSLGPLLSNFSDTAYALSAMDLVITVDTALAHLAGAMGIPTLLLLPWLPDWRWLLGREDSPWYPSLRLYRQPSPGDWDSAISKIFRDLTEGIQP